MGVSRTPHLWVGDEKLARMGTSDHAAWHGLAVFVAVTTQTAHHITILSHGRHDTDDIGMPFPSECGVRTSRKNSAGGHLHQRDEDDAHDFLSHANARGPEIKNPDRGCCVFHVKFRAYAAIFGPQKKPFSPFLAFGRPLCPRVLVLP